MHTLSLLTNIVEHHQVLVYGIIFLGIIIEGEFIIISAGILAHLGALNFWVSLVFIIIGGLSKTFLGYRLGGYLYKKYNHNRFFRYVERQVQHFLPNFKKKPFWSIFISKFIIGANHIVILFCGFNKIDYKKFLQAEITATFIWAPLLLSLGYSFSYTALHISQEIWRFSMIVLILFILFILFDKLVGWIYKLFEEFYNDNQ